MIRIEYVRDGNGAENFGRCASCGKGSRDDPRMVRIIFSNDDESAKISVCLCEGCRYDLYKRI